MGNKKNKNDIEKMNDKKSSNAMLTKIELIVLLIAIVIAIVWVLNNASKGKKEQKVADTNVTSSRSEATTSAKNNEIVGGNTISSDDLFTAVISNQNKETKKTTVKTLSDGTLYSLTDESIVPDLVIGDNYYDTQLADISQNFQLYEGKTIEIEGFYLENSPYTFVGRYSNSNLCSYCPVGYSYFEYEYHGDKELNFTNEGEWLKIVGKLTKGNDGVDYYYIDVLTLEVMNKSGKLTVEN